MMPSPLGQTLKHAKIRAVHDDEHAGAAPGANAT